MKRTKKTTTRITIETERLLVMSRRHGFESWCPACLALVQRLTVDEAAAVAQVELLTVCQWIEAGTIHFAKAEASAPPICAVSLRDLVQSRKDV